MRTLNGVVVGLIGALITGAGAAGPARATEPRPSVQQRIRAATFEVVQLKPPDGDVAYDREPPLDLIPYQQLALLERSFKVPERSAKSGPRGKSA